MDGRDPVAEVLAEWLDARDRGERIEPEQVIRAHPALADQLRARFVAMDMVDQAFAETRLGEGRIPDRIGEYRILREVGRGGMGVVYEAEQTSMRRNVALKVLFPSVMSTPQAVQRFQREAWAIGRLKHTNIVAVHQLAQERGVWYCAMELVHGQPLDRILKTLRKTGRSPSESRLAREAIGVDTAPPTPGRLTGRRAYYARIAEMFAGVAEALQAAHDQEVVHRDVKPANLLLDAEGRLKLVDFGLARLGEGAAGATRTGDLVGTPLYMSPEQVAGKRVDHRTDIYSLGATLYETLALRPAFAGTNIQAISVAILRGAPPSPRRFDPHVPKDLETIVQKAMEREPDRRYRTAAEMAEDLWQAARGGTIRARRIGLGGRAWRLARRHRALSALAAATVVATVLGALAAWRGAVEEGRRRDLEYDTLVASAGALQLERGTESIDRVQAIVIPRSEGGGDLAELYERAIGLRPARPEAYLGRALDASRPAQARLQDLERAGRLGMSDRTRLLAEALVDAETGRWPDATRKMDRAATLPRAGSVDSMLEGRILALRGDFKEAEAALTRAVAELPEPTRRFALYARGLARAATGNDEGALEDFVCLDSASNRNTAVLIRIASLWALLGRVERSHVVLERAIALVAAADSEEAWATLLDTIKSCRFSDALDDVRRRLPEGLRDTHRVLIAWSEALRLVNRIEEAVAAAQRAVGLFPDSAEAHDRLGVMLTCAGRAAEAIPVLKRAIALDPRWMQPRSNYAYALLACDRDQDALMVCDEALRIDPTHRHLRVNRAAALARLGQVEEALAEIDLEVTERAPGSATGHADRAWLLRLKGRYDESLAAANRAIAVDPLRAVGHEERAHTLLCLTERIEPQERAAQALSSLDRALALGPRYPARCHDARAESLRLLGRLDDALEAAERAIALKPNSPQLLYEKARIVFEMHRYADTLDVCDGILARDPGNSSAAALKLNAVIALGRLADATRISAQALEHWPDSAWLWTLRGTCMRKTGHPADALAASNRALELAPLSAEAHIERGWSLICLMKPEEALGAFDAALEITPSQSTLAGRAVALLTLHRPEEALAACGRALELDSTNAVTHAIRGNALASLGNHDDALRALTQAIELDPHLLQAYVDRATLLHRLGRAEDALKDLDRANQIDATIASLHLFRAGVLADLGRSEDALAGYSRVLELDPKSAAAHLGRGTVLWALRRYEDALQEYERSAEIEPNQGFVHRYVGDAQRALHRYEPALAAYQRATECDPNDAIAQRGRASTLVAVGRCEEALQAFERAIKLDPRSPVAFNSMAWLLATAEDEACRNPERAVTLARQAIERAPNDGAIWNTLGVALCAAGAWKDALDALQKSMGLRSGGDAADWLFVALAKKRLGKDDEAQAWFNKAVARIGEHASDNKEMARLRDEVARALEQRAPAPEGGSTRPRRGSAVRHGHRVFHARRRLAAHPDASAHPIRPAGSTPRVRAHGVQPGGTLPAARVRTTMKMVLAKSVRETDGHSSVGGMLCRPPHKVVLMTIGSHGNGSGR